MSPQVTWYRVRDPVSTGYGRCVAATSTTRAYPGWAAVIHATSMRAPTVHATIAGQHATSCDRGGHLALQAGLHASCSHGGGSVPGSRSQGMEMHTQKYQSVRGNASSTLIRIRAG
jgi:hypothetical protein